MTFIKGATTDRAEMIGMLERLLEQAKAGTLGCTALRIFNADGTYEDIAFGGTEEQQAEALAALRRRDD